MIVLIDYKMGNLGSIVNMCKKLGIQILVSSNKEDIQRASKLILPGVGSFDQGMRNLADLDLIELITNQVVNLKIPILGICLGMQLMTKFSEEGIAEGLGWINSHTVRFKNNHLSNLRVPHMGWNLVRRMKISPIYANTHEEARFYFVHSYHVICNDTDDVLTETTYGYNFTSSFQRDHIVGVQFHPEKSHRYGMHLITNFVEFL